ncbi:hypothetical protein [Pseudokineococcus sp. 1T1Z-3]|uniref:hypothetical protein n=1 Tax=Pseudokineococcus sp. 1T1Z-3 TaxID=3132745 RepID=UPI0030AC2FE9
MSTAQAPPLTSPAPPRRAPRVVSVVAAALGGLVLAATTASAIGITADQVGRYDTTLTEPVAGVTSLDLDAAGASVVVSPVTGSSDARLVLDGVRGDWRMERVGSTLVVTGPSRERARASGSGAGHADLSLPASLLRGDLSADLDVLGSSVTVEGRYGDLAVSVTGGELWLGGAPDEGLRATSVAAVVTGGTLTARLEDVAEVDLGVTGGSGSVVATGTPPEEVVVDVTAGSLDLVLPTATYDVTTEAGPWEVVDELTSVPGAPRTVDVSVTAGQAFLSPGS